MNENHDSTSIKSVTLTLTESCNLNCSYCYENHKSEKYMNYETAIRILTYELNEDDNHDFVYIDFFGGEPFLAFDLMKRILIFLRSHKFIRPYSIGISTNGTLVHGDVQDWLIKNKDIVQIGLSLDGNRYMHDINRCGSFDSIDLEFYKKHYARQPVKMTVSKESLPFLFDGIKFCHDNGLQVNCNLAYGIDWSDENNAKLLERELSKIISYYIENPNIEPCSLLSAGISQIVYAGDSKLTRKWCGAGTHMRTYDVFGKKYPCQFFMPMSAGLIKSQMAEGIEFLDEIPTDLLDSRCVDCIIKEVCPSCYGSNYVSTGNIYRKEENLCKLTKIIVLANSFFKAKLLEMNRLQLSDNERQALVSAIVKIQTLLKV